MTEERKVQLAAEVNATGAKKGFEEIKQGGRDMAQAVSQSAQQAGKAVDGIGAGGAAAAQKVDAATRSIIGSIQRTTAVMDAGERGTRKFYEALAAQRGVNVDILRPYLEQLDAVAAKQAQATSGLAAQSAAMSGTAVSAKQLQFALRGVPAQFTDIATSLASGQRPLQVLLQQGGQLKDMFGGIAPAARALGGYIAGLVNPVTVTAGVVAVLAVAFHQGSEELRAFQNAATLSGNAIGLTNSQFAQLRESIGAIATQGKAAEALTAIAESGLVAGDNVRGIAEAAILMERATGQSIAKTVDQFKELARSPADAAAKLNEQFNFLTAAIFRQVQALEEQGRKTEAANLIERVYADELKTRARAVVDNAGLMEKAWRSAWGAAKGFWDTIVGIGRPATTADQIGTLQRQLSDRQGRNRDLGIGDKNGDTAVTQDLKVQIDLLRENDRLEQRLAERQAERARLTSITVGWEKQGEQFLTKRQQLEKELTKAQVEGQQLVNAGIITEQELRTRLAGIRQKYNDTTGQGEVAGIRARITEQQQYLKQLQDQLAKGTFGQDAKLTDGEKKVLDIQEQLKTGITGVARAEKEKALAAAQSLVVVDKQVDAQERQNKAYQDAVGHLDKLAATTSQQAESIQQQALSQEAANESFGKSKTAIEAMVLAQLKLQAAEADASDTFDPRYVAGLNAKIDAQQRYVDALKQAEFLQSSRQLDETGRVSQEEAATLQLELSLVGQTQEVRQRVVALRRVEVALAKELSDIDKKNISEDEKQQLRAKARANSLVDASNAAAKSTLDEWDRTADSINQSLTDALMRGFESGKDFASNFRDTLKNMFGTLVLRPLIKAVMAPVSGAISTIGQGISQAVVGGGGSSLGGLGSLASLGSSVVGGMSLGNAGATLFANATGTGIDGLMAATGAFGTAAEGAAAGTGILGAASGALASIGPVGWVALAALAAYSIFGGKGGGPKTESGAGLGVRATGDVAGVSTIIKQIQSKYSGIVKGLGGSPGQLDLGIFSSQDPQGTALTQLAFNATLNGQSIENRGARLGSIENVGRSDAELQAAIAAETERVVLAALQASNLTGSIGDYLKQLGDINGLSDGAIADSLTRAQTIATQQAQLESTLFDLTHTDLQKLTKTRQDERAAIDDTNRALYDQVAQLTDLATAAQSALTGVDTARTGVADAYQRESAALQSLVQQHETYADQLRKVRDSLNLGTGAGVSRAQATARAGQTFQSTLARAFGGDTDALQALGGAGTAFVDAAKASARTPAEVAAVIGRVQAGLTTVAASEDARATVAQQQLDAMTQQLTALGVINTTVQTVGNALAGYLQAVNVNTAAQTALQAAQLRATGSTTVSGNPVTFSDADIRAAVAALSGGTGSLPGFASGGLALGAALVGERGREVIDLDTPGRVYTSEQTRGMFATNAELMPAITELCRAFAASDENRRREAIAMLQQITTVASKLKKFDTDGLPPVRVTP